MTSPPNRINVLHLSFKYWIASMLLVMTETSESLGSCLAKETQAYPDPKKIVSPSLIFPQTNLASLSFLV